MLAMFGDSHQWTDFHTRVSECIYINIYIIIHEICSLDSIIKTHIDILHGLHEGKVIIPQRE